MSSASGEMEADAALRLDVARAMETLDERNRELLALRYGADLTAKQIAEVLGVRTNAVEVALHRALGKLRTVLEEPRGRREAHAPTPPPAAREVSP